MAGTPSYGGGHELRSAFALLAGKRTTSPGQLSPPSSLPTPSQSPSQQPGWHVPPHLLRLPAHREAALHAHDWALQANRQPGSFDLVYHYGLALQELAARLAASPADQLSLLQQACEVYGVAAALQPDAFSALYNWGVALSDIARIVRPQQPEEAYECLTAAAQKYARALEANPANPQALNNWGLVLQDLASLRPRSERALFLQRSLSKFRQAIRMWPDFDRACYNLGTVLYAHACALQEELLASHDGLENSGAPAGAAHAAAEQAVRTTFAHAGQYIALAYALQPSKPVYADSLAAVQRLLPLPYLRSGPLLAVHPKAQDSPAEHWVRCWFGVDGSGLKTVRPPASEAGAGGATQPYLSYDLEDILDARVCLDPSLPAGYGVWVSLGSRPQGIFLVSSEREDAEGWVDAVKLLLHIQWSGRQAVLRQALGGASAAAAAAVRRASTELSGRLASVELR